MSTALRDALTKAYDIADSGGDLTADALRPSQEEMTETQTQAKAFNDERETEQQRARDDAGRFAKEKAERAAKAKAPAAAPAAETPTPLERPKSWKKDYEPHWQKLVSGQSLTPDEARKLAEYNIQRESEFTNGVTTYKNIAEQAKPVLDALAPYLQTMQQHGITPGQEVKMLLNAHHTLAMGSPQQKHQMFAQLANEYGIDLRAFNGGQQSPPGGAQPGFEQQQPQFSQPQFSQFANALNQMQGRLQQFETAQQQQQREAAQSTVEMFGQNKPHFDKVRGTMADMIDKGFATSLDDAYDKACRLDDEIQTQIRADQELEQKNAKAQQATAARNRTVSPRSSAPTAMATQGTKKSLRDTLSDQYDAHAGRV